MFDTDIYIQKIIESGAPEAQARAIIRSIVESQNDLASQRDLKDMERVLHADISELEGALRTDINELERVLKSDLAAFKVDITHTVNLLDKTLSLKITGLYAFMALIAGGVAKLVFVP